MTIIIRLTREASALVAWKWMWGSNQRAQMQAEKSSDGAHVCINVLFFLRVVDGWHSSPAEAVQAPDFQQHAGLQLH